MKKNSIRLWELSLLMALCISLCWGAFELGRQNALAEKIIRMHVVASGDTEEEQRTKMKVKQAVEAQLAPLMEESATLSEACRAIERSRSEILAAAEEAAQGERVELIFGLQAYPTRYAQTYALPAGEYMSLRILIGEGAGHNWWGVIFPYLMPEEVLEHYGQAMLQDEEGIGVFYESQERVVSFRILELVQLVRQWLGR